MDRAAIVVALKNHYPELSRQFGVASLALFGSASRDTLRPESDIDILVTFAGPATFDRYFGLKNFLEELLRRPVDLATPNMLKPRLQKAIEDELLRVA